MYLVINAHMWGMESAPGEPSWSVADEFTDEDFRSWLGTDAATYAEENPHMIVMEV